MTDIMDYTREDYVLLEDGDVALYNDYGDIFHITNLTYFRELINSDKSYSNKKYRYNNLHGNNENEVAYINDLDTEPEIEIIETLLEQIQNKDRREG